MDSVLDEAILARLRELNPRYHERAYVFVLAALHQVLERVGARHITGRELAEGARDLALQEFGPMARTVLEHWGIRDTSDFGGIVFALVECGILIKQDTDSPEDFRAVFDFSDAFDHHYPWGSGIQP